MTPPPALHARGVSFAYPGEIRALTEIDFAAEPGQLVAVVGSNGSGKTTLMKVLMRLLVPQAGNVLLGESDIRKLAAADLYRQLGMVFQNPADQLFGATVEQDVAFGPRNLGLAEADVARRVDESLAAVDASDLRDRPIHHLSFGEQKRVSLAGTLAMQPSILLLDEPTAGLDPAGEGHLVELLIRLNRERRMTLILATHAVDLLPALADRIYVLCKGRVQRAGTPQEILADPESAARAGLRLPQIARLFHELAHRDRMSLDRLPLTVEEARQQILAWLGNGSNR